MTRLVLSFDPSPRQAMEILTERAGQGEAGESGAVFVAAFRNCTGNDSEAFLYEFDLDGALQEDEHGRYALTFGGHPDHQFTIIFDKLKPGLCRVYDISHANGQAIEPDDFEPTPTQKIGC